MWGLQILVIAETIFILEYFVFYVLQKNIHCILLYYGIIILPCAKPVQVVTST